MMQAELMMGSPPLSPTIAAARRISLVEAKAIARRESDVSVPGRKPNLTKLPELSSKSQLELMTLLKDGKLTQDGAMAWAEERSRREVTPKLSNEQQLELLNKVKLGRISVDEALAMASGQVCAAHAITCLLTRPRRSHRRHRRCLTPCRRASR